MQPLTLEMFKEVNEAELRCIFAESGVGKEQDFDLEEEILKLYEKGPNEYNLVYFIEPSSESF